MPSGIATFTDRVLPDLLPVTDVAAFDSVLTRAVAIESPPPVETLGVRVTNYVGLEDIGSGNYFDPGVARRVVVLLTDGESLPFDPRQIAAQLSRASGYRFLAIRFWAAGEGVYDANGRREPGYHPSPAGKVLLAQLAAGLGGRSYEEADLGAAADYLHQIVGTGRTVTHSAPGGECAYARTVRGRPRGAAADARAGSRARGAAQPTRAASDPASRRHTRRSEVRRST